MLRKLQIFTLPAALLAAVIVPMFLAASRARPTSMGDTFPMGYHVHNIYGDHDWR
jgi:hypothetical protein